MAAVKMQRGAGGVETHFAKKLASNEKKVRDKAVKKLRVWISTRRSVSSGLCETDLLKLWKGLFYCMWMSDKPKVQEELAETIAQLLHSFESTNSALDFLDGFFKTMSREWHGIDRLRLDKFYLLIRKFMYQSIVLLKNHGWNDETICLLNKSLENGPLSSANNSLLIPDGVQVHVVQVYLDELFKLDSGQIPSSTFLKLMDPFSHLLATSKSKVITRTVSKEIFDKLLEKKKMHEMDFQALAEQFFSWASRQDIPARNRNILYEYISKFKIACRREEDGGNKRGIKEGLVSDVDKSLNNNNLDIDENESMGGAVNGEETHKEEKTVVENIGENINLESADSNKVRSKMTKKVKEKGFGKRKCEDVAEDCTTERGNSTMDEGVDSKTSSKRSKSNGNEVSTDISENGQDITTENGEKKKKRKKRRSERVVEENVSHMEEEIQMMTPVNFHVFDDQKLTQEESDFLDGSYLSTIPLPKRKLRSFGRKCAETETAKIKKIKVTQAKDTLNVNVENNSTESEKNGSGKHRSFTEEASIEITDPKMFLETVDQVKSSEEQDVSAIPDSAPLAMFIRHSVKKVKVNTEPRKKKGRKLSVGGLANSAPGNRRKQVRIELSKNTSHTTQDYRRSLKSSPIVPFDATKKPVQSSLKTPPVSQITTKNGTDRTLRSLKRPSATDFF